MLKSVIFFLPFNYFTDKEVSILSSAFGMNSKRKLVLKYKIQNTELKHTLKHKDPYTLMALLFKNKHLLRIQYCTAID